ncbi:MAG: glutamate racemase [Leptotrichiaceae bacterium]|jgi:glutamate racemase|nr:glutamate racemase [Leptotrichiaceae bacterium]MBP6168088.1 glutamate racemase [Leptotrichiaceae bacterium]
MAIGIFDSGIGGLTVLREVRKILPNEEIYYFGDTARLPYGDKTKDLIIRYSKQIVDFLLEKKVVAIVVACNTATSLALEELNDTYKTPIIGVIDAGVRTALKTTKTNSVGIVGTKATVNSKKYEIELKKANSEMKVYSKACPLFVPVVEEGILEGELVNQVLKYYLDDIVDGIDSLVLGCTHYPLLKNAINHNYPNIKVVDPAIETANDLKRILEEKNLLMNKGGVIKYYFSDGIDKAKQLGTMFLDEEMEHVELVKL